MVIGYEKKLGNKLTASVCAGQFHTAQESAKRMFCVYEGDHLTLLNVYNAFIRVSGSLMSST